jgi:hypothetical protein
VNELLEWPLQNWTYSTRRCTHIVKVALYFETRGLSTFSTATVRSPVENPWLECGVVGDTMPCDREKEM